MKRTVIVADATAAAALYLEAARNGRHGVEIRTMEQVAERLAGGFLRCVDEDTLYRAATEAVRAATDEGLGDLCAIRNLPGLPSALAATLSKAWHAGLELVGLAAEQPGSARLAALAGLEREVLRRLPADVLHPPALAARAARRLPAHVGVLGTVELAPMLDVAPCWRVLVLLLHRPRCLHWRAGTHPVPNWWRSACGDEDWREPLRPQITTVTCANAWHEVIEAMRWARGLLASGLARPQEVAFAAASPGEYDDLLLATAAEAGLDIHFAHGRRALATRDGQAAAALADILLRGLSRDRVVRLARLSHPSGTPFGDLPEGWVRALPAGAPLGSPMRWRQAAIAVALPKSVMDVLLPAVELLARGVDAADAAGERFLRGKAQVLWRRALARAPASALEASLSALRGPDAVEAGTSIAWMPAAALACSPRPYVWLLGLNARTWPRSGVEDPLLSDHLIPKARLEPVSVAQADRHAFAAIRDTSRVLVCSAGRRDATGRLLGLSPLMPAAPELRHLRRARIPEHAMSEPDRMMARPDEFAATSRARSAALCWRNWRSSLPTAHDGLVRPGHPVLARALDRIHSATSLRMLLRNPLGYTWRYALGWREPDNAAETMALDHLAFGNLVHAMLQAALPGIEAAGGLARSGPAAIAGAVADARAAVAARWEAEQPVPPEILWSLHLDEAEAMTRRALSHPHPELSGQRSHSEVLFGDPASVDPDADVALPTGLPWHPADPVELPGTGLRIQGVIDRLDVSADRSRARVVDYKTGKPRDPGTLAGGGELQRCLYACAVRALLGPGAEVEAALLFPRGEEVAYHRLGDPKGTLDTLVQALLAARDSLCAGRALPGPDTGGAYDDLAFALPAGPGGSAAAKQAEAKAMLGSAALIWEHA